VVSGVLHATARVATIARTELVRLFRDRGNVFFVLVFPLLLVMMIGLQFGGGGDTRIGAVAPADDAAAARLLDAIEAAEGFVVSTVGTAEELEDAVGRGQLSAGLVVPDGFDHALREGDPVEVAYVGRADASSASLRAVVQAAAAAEGTATAAAGVAGEVLDRPVEELVEVARTVDRAIAPVTVVAQEAGGDELAREFAGLGQFDLGASTQLVLFTFLTALAGGASLIQTRELGVARRMLATPTPSGALLTGHAAGRIAVALLQAGYLVLATWLLFRVDWGDPVASGAVIVMFAIVAGAAGMLVGATFRNDSQAGGVGVGLGLGLAALGGSMVPLELFPPVMRTLAYLTPHAWANQAFAEILRRDGGVTDVLLELAVLAVFAVVLLTLGTLRLRRVLTR
jgi:ABC-2 type transport system permease protein